MITEGEKQDDGDWTLFGYCHILEWEWGYVSLKELESVMIKLGELKFSLERDLYAKGTVRELKQ